VTVEVNLNPGAVFSSGVRLVLAVGAVTLAGCSAASPFGIAVPDSTHQEQRVMRGVINGLWQFDPQQNAERLTGEFGGVSAGSAEDFADRYQVRVGIKRSWLLGQSSEISVLPEGWSYSLDRVVDDGQTVKIGDVVDIQTEPGTRLESVVRIVRQCDQPPVPGENHDWDIGCKLEHRFGSNGYAGEVYVLTAF
jgi:hypothetical protein